MKYRIKQVRNCLGLAVALPLFAVYELMSLSGNRDSVFWACSQLLSLLPGKFGNVLRGAFYRLAMTSCSQESAICFGTIFAQQDTEIGRGVYIGPQCNIGKCKIENDCTLGSGVHILSGKQQHGFQNLEAPIREQGGILEKVVIGEDSWIGNCNVVMANVGRKCIIGAGSVVTKDIEPYSIAAGNPARVLRKRETVKTE